jgi:hypothetical protein
LFSELARENTQLLASLARVLKNLSTPLVKTGVTVVYRVQMVGNAGLKLSKVTVADAGKYAIEVVIKGSPITTYLQRNMHLAVSGK